VRYPRQDVLWANAGGARLVFNWRRIALWGVLAYLSACFSYRRRSRSCQAQNLLSARSRQYQAQLEFHSRLGSDDAIHGQASEGTVADNYTDRAISGASLLLRPGIQELIHDALRGRFDIVLAEAMDRLSRDQEDIAGL
jgi:DNA invertase Pin-like site-specific DNA recombinase